MNKQPIISVIMPVYNAEHFIKEAIESILAQTYTNFEFIIINDGSTDKSDEIIKSFPDSRIQIISQSNQGVIGALNAGLAIAQGIYIARMDADDISEPKRLEKQVVFMQTHPNIILCGTWARTINEAGTILDNYDYPPANHIEIRKSIVRWNPFIHPSIMLKHQALATVGVYSPKYKYAEDYELWTRIVAKYETANIPEYLLRYRISAESITQKNWSTMVRKALLIRILAVMRIWLKIPI